MRKDYSDYGVTSHLSRVQPPPLLDFVSGCVEVRINGGHRCGSVAITGAGDDSERRVGI